MFFSKQLLSGPAQGGGVSGWVSALLGSTRSDAGPVVTPASALSLTVLQNCVSLLAESIAQLPLELYRRAGGDRVPAVDHPLYAVLKYQPNPWQTPFEYQEMTQISAGLRGNSYSFIDRDADGVVQGLYPLNGEAMTVLRGSDLKPVYRMYGAEPMPQRLVHHVRWMSLNGYTGLSPILLHANAIGYAQAIQQYAGKSFLNGTALSGVIERPKDSPAIKDQSSIDKITGDWAEKYGGASNAKKVALLQEGMTFRPLSMTNVDAALIDALRLSAIDIARIYKIPAHMVNELERATFSNIEHQQIQFVIYTLLPWIKRHEQAKSRDLLLPSERREYFIEYNVSGLLRGDQASRYAAYSVARQWGWLSVNDIRRLENLPPIEGGDIYLSPLNMVDATKPIPLPPGKSEPTRAEVKEIERILS
ncbi:phage portal protein [Cupriavidus basilensis]|uniref:Phage portal protein n=1 Tax=Cupriavidus basilensis TaxID=68895 RepID=A0ABT6AXD5_9BURK|nr:phage portal protein [Cupriavidus basilensis]MDF3837144.1 phage portal protein [Cupriavidus basilensis]